MARPLKADSQLRVAEFLRLVLRDGVPADEAAARARIDKDRALRVLGTVVRAA